MKSSKSFVFRFAEFEVHESEFLLFKAGQKVPVEPKDFRLLLVLLKNPQRLISKADLLNAVWSDASVTENSLARSIFKLRKVLNDDVKSPTFIETVTTAGYRLICRVEVVEESDVSVAPIRSEPNGQSQVPGHLGLNVVPSIKQSQVPSAESRAHGEIDIDDRHTPDSEEISPLRTTPYISPRRYIRVTPLILLVLVILSGWWFHRSSRIRWALDQAFPEIQRLVDNGQLVKAAMLVKEAQTALPDDPRLEKLWMQATGEISIASVPSGADITYRPYQGDPNTWETLGKTPQTKVRLPRDHYVWRVSKPGFASVSFIGEPAGVSEPGSVFSFELTAKLRPQNSVPPEMLPVLGGEVGLNYPTEGAPGAEIGDFMIDRSEVTNEQYKKFVDAGGYQRREFWRQVFVRNGKTIPWEKAMTYFRDATGRPGPSTWEGGNYPNGKENHPVAGVSWYEAAAYAEFAGKSLPTAYHWTAASQSDFTALIAAGSNFKGEGTRPVGSANSLSGSGTVDMAGNVKEWCLNEGREGRRFILGGGFGEPEYMFNYTDEQSPWDRLSNFGFRCVKLDTPPNSIATARIDFPSHDYSKDKPVSDEVFKAYAEQFSYDKKDLHARVEETETTKEWTREKVSFDAAYGHERVSAYLYLPKGIAPPFQTVVYYPGAMSFLTDKLDLPAAEATAPLDFTLKSGRALMFPIYKGMYDRRDGYVPGAAQPAFIREHRIAFSKDLGRSIDYLETRKDIDATKLAYFGFSAGGHIGGILLAIEKRIKVMIISSGGFPAINTPPDVDPINFVSHVTVPVLMINGRYDQDFPLESSQLPFFRNLGTPAKQKKKIIYEGGHGVFPHPDAVRECLDWLDIYLGPVKH